jgi:hypothetical protein
MKIISLFLAAVFLLCTASAYAYKDNDFQVWNTDVQEFQVTSKVKIALEEEFRWGGSAKDFYYQHYDLGFFFNLRKDLTAGGGYRHVLSKSRDKFLVENEPYLSLTWSGELAGFKFDDRSRLELNHFDYKDDTWTYRNKFTLKAPWKFTRLQIQPYLSDEIFILMDDGQRLSKNRFFAGLGMSLTKRLKAEIYYMLQSSKSPKWTEANVLGTKLKLSF